jgi:hypothetical protein
MSINTILQVLIELIAGLLLAMAAMIASQQRQGLMLSLPNGGMLPGDLFELKRLGLQLMNVSKGGVTRV